MKINRKKPLKNQQSKLARKKSQKYQKTGQNRTTPEILPRLTLGIS